MPLNSLHWVCSLLPSTWSYQSDTPPHWDSFQSLKVLMLTYFHLEKGKDVNLLESWLLAESTL